MTQPYLALEVTIRLGDQPCLNTFTAGERSQAVSAGGTCRKRVPLSERRKPRLRSNRFAMCFWLRSTEGLLASEYGLARSLGVQRLELPSPEFWLGLLAISMDTRLACHTGVFIRAASMETPWLAVGRCLGRLTVTLLFEMLLLCRGW